jgi:hypothetical protein
MKTTWWFLKRMKKEVPGNPIIPLPKELETGSKGTFVHPFMHFSQ